MAFIYIPSGARGAAEDLQRLSTSDQGDILLQFLNIVNNPIFNKYLNNLHKFYPPNLIFF